MPKSPDQTKPRKNATEERLRATPFKDVSKLDAEEESIRLSTWQRMTEVKVFTELLTKPEFATVKEELKAGLSCGTSALAKERIYKIYSEGKGMHLELNEEYLKTLGDGKIPMVQGAIQAGIEGWGSLYWQAKGLLSRPSVDSKDVVNKSSKKA